MDPRPENEFPIRNPWIPLAPDQILSRSNGVSVDRNGNQLRTRDRSEYFQLLNRYSEQTPNYNGAGNTVNLSAQLNQSRGAYGMSDHKMGNGILTSGNSCNLTAPLNQSSGSYNMSNYQMGNRIFTSGSSFNLTVPLNQSSGSSDLSNYPRGNRISEGGNSFNLNRPMNQSSSSNSMVNPQRGNGILTSDYSSNFSRPLNQSSGSYDRSNSRMGNGNLGTYLNSQTQSNRNDIPSWRNISTGSNRGLIANTVQQQLFCATSMPLHMAVPKTDAVISSPILNLNMRPLSPPRGMNLPNAPSILNAYSEVDSSWTEGNFTSLLLGNEIPDLGRNKWSHSNNSPQMLNYGFQDPLQQYNLNSPPRHRGNGGTSNVNSFPFAPITPDHTNLLEKHRQAQLLKFLVDDGPCQEQDKLENLVLSIGKETIENHCSELLETIVGPSASVVSEPQTENKITEDRNDQNVIDLNETPKQKVPKRRKHRPKVVIEGKPKRTPKAKTPNNGEPEKNPPKKRKYVRKNRDPDAENTTPQQTNVINTVKDPHFEYQKESCRKRLNFDFEKSEDENQHIAAKNQVAHHEGNQQVLDLNLSFPANQMLVKSLAGEESHALTTPSEIITYSPLNIIARNLSTRNKENRANRKVKGESKKNISRANLNLEKSREMRWKSTHQMVERDVGNFKGFCVSNGEGSQLIEQEDPSSENKELISPKDGDSNEETRKKQKIENDHQTTLCGPEKGSDINGTSGESTVIDKNYMQRKCTAVNQEMDLERTRENIPSKSNQVHSTGYFAVMTNSNLQSAVTSKKTATSGYQHENENYQASMQTNRLHMTANPCREVSFCTNEVPLQESEDTLHQYRQLPKTTRGRPKVMKYSKKMVDEITVRLQRLSISDKNGETDGKDNYALVPYGGGGAVVPYEPKKRKPRPKVDLDPETNRIWKLLMGKEGTEASEGENRDKEKWWEEERRVFHGRAESFIARMHLVQGNRRFSPWKGSVVDSIIGVFLTQNVSDQLSSSAFMALAAQFPLGSATTDQASDQSGTSILTEENAISSQNSSSGSSSEPESSSNGGKPIITSAQHEYRTPPLQVAKNSENGQCLDDRSMLYYKQSLEPDQNKQIQGSDRFTNLNTFSPLNHSIGSSIFSTQNSDIPPSYFQLLMAPLVARSEADCCEISREECRSSFPSKAPEMAKGERISYQDNSVERTEDMMSKTLLQQYKLKNSQTQNMDPFRSLMNHLTAQKSSVHQVHQVGPLSLNTHQVERSQIYESEHTGFKNLSGMGEQVITRKSGAGSQIPIPNHTGQIVDSQQGTSAANNQEFLGDVYEKNIGVSAKTLKTSQKHDKARESFDWDSLRKTVQLNGGVKERSVDASDSMDYEAMRCADVNMISNSIRIRGMNNMLAERIQDFLNRVVADHGSIDLEWLRDVPPDKAKDYLLSIRGLGLKSVECVRLLHLHHLAFPVDTNVGRIAVRLGWVPLQPLPESLQLHLLEMYPVLETVQKFLWPRLCKLDQKTLYELHYQLITFGKVFCTKSKPNCNACPMRGECRHFASAFASARLALPAPEDKSIVGSTMPIPTGRTADVPMNPMLLQLPGSNGEREMMVNRCEPIIEEPASPEPEIAAIEETDIEDAFYEDPDEIPTIRLNVEQLAVNLRNFMEEHTDMQEEDMSKALVALAPEVASIPAPKLKYVLRLRTERQVYVLTDAHPLVEGLDKREPDDPSPYLLALLAPGEEAGSDQPSGKSCESNGSGELCNEKEGNSLTVKGTLLIPCRTAMRGSFPLNGTYFQVNEVFADHESSVNPIDVPREWLWHLETRTVFFGTSATSIFRGMTTKEIQNTCWRGFVCVRGFDRGTRAPRPLNRNLHLAQNKTVKTSNAAK